MRRLTSSALLILFLPSVSFAQHLSMTWGLENTWSYDETKRAPDEDLASHSKSKGKNYRTFAFTNRNEVIDPMLKCFSRHFELWETYRKSITDRPAPPQGLVSDNSNKSAFEAFKAQRDPFCSEQLKKQAPSLYFDFVADSSKEYVLERIEIQTLAFSEYKGGGFALGEAWYDILLSHKVGLKGYDVQKKLVFSGHGRAQLRFWSDNFYPSQGWIAPMGEYLITVRFVFTVAGHTETVTTDPFKIDV